ncbi:MAG: hypothetical protein ACRDRJ_04725 [Streptosporangiaceae bacterium]
MALHDEGWIAQEQGIVDGELLADGDIPHADEQNVAAHADIRLARMIQQHYHAFVFIPSDRRKKMISRDLEAEFLIASGKAATTELSTIWPPLTATTSPSAMAWMACTPRPSMTLAPPLSAFGVIHEQI